MLTEKHALNRNVDFRNTRDAEGLIFPIGDVDPRVPVHEDVIGAITVSGIAVAFPQSIAFLALRVGQKMQFENIERVLHAGGVMAIDAIDESCGRVVSHQAYWIAWSRFYPQTTVWLN